MENGRRRRSLRSGIGVIRRREEVDKDAYSAMITALGIDASDLSEVRCYGLGQTISIIHAQIVPRFGHVLVITHTARYPSWDEIAEARYQLIPDDVMMVLPLPPSDRFVNLHPGSFILCQVKLGRIDSGT